MGAPNQPVSPASKRQKIAVYTLYWCVAAIVGTLVFTNVIQQITVATTPMPSMEKRAFDAWCSRRILSAHERLEPQSRPGRAEVTASEIDALAQLCAPRSEHLAEAINMLHTMAHARNLHLENEAALHSQRDQLLAMITRFSRGE